MSGWRSVVLVCRLVLSLIGCIVVVLVFLLEMCEDRVGVVIMCVTGVD